VRQVPADYALIYSRMPRVQIDKAGMRLADQLKNPFR
jgi:hypothetical protein